MNDLPKCPHCSGTVPQGAAFCPICGGALPTGEQVVGAPQDVPTEIICQRCGKKYPPPPPNFCESCGYPLRQETSPQVRKPAGEQPVEQPAAGRQPAQPPRAGWAPYLPGVATQSAKKAGRAAAGAANVASDKRRLLPGLLKLAAIFLLVAIIAFGAWYAWSRWISGPGGGSQVEACSPVSPDESYEEANRLDLEGDLRRDSYFRSGQEYTIAADATFRIPDGRTLIIEPGARVKFGEGAKMVVEGTLFACGKSNRRILFTANTTTGKPGFWAGVEIRDADPQTVIGHASFEYGGKDAHAPLWMEASDVHLEDLKFDSNLWYPLSLDPNSYPLLRPPLLVENGPQGWEIRSGEMTSAQSWDNAQPYIIRDLLTIAEEGSLAISAGATVKFLKEAAINIHGDLSALGESGKPVRFTSYNDGGDEGSPEPQPSDWVGLRFYGRKGQSRLENVEIAYGGQTGYREVGCLWMQDSSPQLVNVSLSHCAGYAISTDIASDPAIEKLSLDETDITRRWELRGGNLEGPAQHSLLAWKTTDGEAFLPVVTGWVGVTEKASLVLAPGVTLLFAQGDTGLWADGALQVNGERKQPILLTSMADPDYSAEGGAAAGDWGGLYLKNSLAQNSALRNLRIRYAGRNNSSCLGLENASPAMQDVSISECAGYPVSSDAASQPTVENLDIRQNSRANLWEIRESRLDEPKTWSWASLPGSGKEEIVRLVTGVITVGPGASLRLAPGLSLKFVQGKGIEAEGALIVEGTQKQPVLMTSWRDLLDGMPEGAPQPGDWGGLILKGAAGTSLSYLEIRYAGNAPSGVGGLNLVGSQPVINNLSITQCGYYPVTSDLASQPKVENLLLADNQPANEWAIRESQLANGEQRSWEPLSQAGDGEPVLRTVVGRLTVQQGAVLSVTKGVVVKFAGRAGLSVAGRLAISGERRDPVIFTSWRDAEFSQEAGAQPGDWAGMVFDGVQADSTLEHLQVRYAGGEQNPRGAIVLLRASPNLRQVAIHDSAWYPLSLDAASNPLLEQVALANNSPANAAEVRAEALEASGEVVWSPWTDADGLPLPRLVNGMLAIGAQASLRLLPDTVVKFSPEGGLDISGSFTADQAVLTSLHDDEYGGDADGNQSGEKRWQGVILRGRNLVQLEDTLLRFSRIGIKMEDAAPQLSSVRIADSWEAALGSDMFSTPQLVDLRLENNAIDGMLILVENLPPGLNRWELIGSPTAQVVRVVRSSLTVGADAQLALAPGVIVKFAPLAGLIVEGQLQAGEADGERVILTAISDDENGGNTDNLAQIAARGAWNGLVLNPNNTAVAASLNNVSILYATTGIQVLNPVQFEASGLLLAESQLYGISCQAPVQLPIGVEEGIEFDNNTQDISGCVADQPAEAIP